MLPRVAALLLALGVGVVANAAAGKARAQAARSTAAPLPEGSLFRLDVRLEPAGGGERQLRSLAGHPTVIAMFYSSCTSVCPMLVLEMQRIESALGSAERDRVQFAMVSLDAERDQATALEAFAAEHHLDRARWLLAHASARDVRTLAAALGVRYRQLPDKSFSHSSVITLLDAEGVARDRTSVPSTDQAEFLQRVRDLLR